MDTIGLIVMVVVLVLVIGGIFGYIKTQRALVNLDEKCKNALSQIEVQLNSRWDALMSLAKAATSYAQHEAETLAATIAARRGVEIHWIDATLPMEEKVEKVLHMMQTDSL